MATFTRKQLYERVWSQSAVQLAKDLGVSDVTIAKTCKKYHIPKPSPGYWAKVEHGHPVSRPALPALDDPDLQQISIEPVAKWLLEDPISEETARKMQAEKSEEHRIVVAADLDSPHRLVKRTLVALRKQKADAQGLVHTAGKGCLDVSVGTESIDRAMLLLDALLKAAESRGMTISVEDKEVHWTTVIRVDAELISLRLTESLGERPKELTAYEKQQNAKYTHYQPYPTVEKYARGLLTITAQGKTDSYIQRRWSELDGKKLETRLNLIIAWLFQGADRMKERTRRFAERERQWKLEEQRRAEEADRQRKEQARIKELESQVLAWHRAQQIRGFADAVEQSIVSKNGPIAEASAADNWLKWVRAYAHSIDPIGR